MRDGFRFSLSFYLFRFTLFISSLVIFLLRSLKLLLYLFSNFNFWSLLRILCIFTQIFSIFLIFFIQFVLSLRCNVSLRLLLFDWGRIRGSLWRKETGWEMIWRWISIRILRIRWYILLGIIWGWVDAIHSLSICRLN